MPGHAGDVGAQPFFGAGRAHALGQRGRDIFAVVPQQRMPAQLHLVVAGIGGDRVGRPEIQGVRVVAEHIDLHLVLRHHDGAFARDDRAIGRIVDRRGPTGIDRGSEQDALGRRQIAQRNITLRHQSRRERSHHQAAGHPDKLLPTGHRRALPLGFHHPLLVLCNDICMAPRKRQGHGEAGEFGQSSRRASPQSRAAPHRERYRRERPVRSACGRAHPPRSWRADGSRPWAASGSAGGRRHRPRTPRVAFVPWWNR